MHVRIDSNTARIVNAYMERSDVKLQNETVEYVATAERLQAKGNNNSDLWEARP